MGEARTVKSEDSPVLTCQGPLKAWAGVAAPCHLKRPRQELPGAIWTARLADQRTLVSTERPCCSEYNWRVIELDPDINFGFPHVPSHS